MPDLKLCRNIDCIRLSTRMCKLWFSITAGETVVIKEARESQEICAVNLLQKKILTDGHVFHLPFFECNLQSIVRS